MKNWFKIDYYKLVRLLLPTMLRRPVVLAFLEAIISSIDWLYGLFGRNRNANLYHLSITPQVCRLEKALNDRFDSSQRRIYISDGTHYEALYLYTDGENVPIWLEPDVYLHTGGESGEGNIDFIVNVPAGLVYDQHEMEALVRIYKLASKTFIINRS
jgi:hypothetical protein